MARKARARLLYHTISTSERVSALGAGGALLFTWLLAHCDDQGRYAGSARRIKAEVVPMVDELTVEGVEKALKAMASKQLITRYRDNKWGELIQIVDWWEFQATSKTPSRYPPPDKAQEKRTDELTRTIAQLKIAAKAIGLNVKALAKLIGITDRALRCWASGSHYPEGANLQRLLKVKAGIENGTITATTRRQT
jgi:DNA-binding transcriptional regulator YiaG